VVGGVVGVADFALSRVSAAWRLAQQVAFVIVGVVPNEIILVIQKQKTLETFERFRESFSINRSNPI
jgi:hypothetical protein